MAHVDYSAIAVADINDTDYLIAYRVRISVDGVPRGEYKTFFGYERAVRLARRRLRRLGFRQIVQPSIWRLEASA